jgi:ATP-binding cassette, subfamily B, bacterial PglK
MNIYRKSISLLSAREKSRGLIVLILAIVMALFEVAGVASVLPFLSVLANPSLVETNEILNYIYQFSGIKSIQNFLFLLGIGAVITIISAAVVRTLGQYALTRFAQMRRHSLASKLLTHYLAQPYSFFLHRHSSDLSKIILSEVDQVINGVFQPSAIMVGQIFTLLALMSFIFLVDPIVAIIACTILASVYGLIFYSIQTFLKGIGHDQIIANKERFEAAGEALGGIKEIKLLGREQYYIDKFNQPSMEMAKTISMSQVAGQIPKFTIEAIAFGGILLLSLVLLSRYGGHEQNALGQVLPLLGLYAFAGYRLIPSVQLVYFAMTQVQFLTSAIDNIYNDLKNFDSEASDPPGNNLAKLDFKSNIEFKSIDYSYPQSPNLSLNNISFKIEHGSSIGLIGSTGAGKSTLADIVLGLLKPNSGEIFIDQIRLHEGNIRLWQKNVGYVPQDIFLIDASIKENIAMGITLDQIDELRIEECIRLAQLTSFIYDDLPDGDLTKVGERGVRLSGGQKQRIGIARALYHDPKFILFDEATSALDNITEEHVMRSLESLASSKTLLIIAHRLTTLQFCDKIILLDQGQIKAIGTYDELFSSSPLFQQMVNSKAIK